MWSLLILSLPTENATVRMRAWRTVKALGAASLRDGVYVLPTRPDCDAALAAIAQSVRDAGGRAHVLATNGSDDDLRAQFDRTEAYAGLRSAIAERHAALAPENAHELIKQARTLRKRYARLAAIDYFPGEARVRVERALLALEADAHRGQSPGEPEAATGTAARATLAEYQDRTWATRRRPWVDRLASAWLIGRFIDPRARFVWIGAPDELPARAVGFDFDGADFSHAGEHVTFETLLTAFDLQRPTLDRIAALVHHLDVGGPQPPDAIGVESVLMGLRTTLLDDDALLNAANQVFDALHATYATGAGG